MPIWREGKSKKLGRRERKLELDANKNIPSKQLKSQEDSLEINEIKVPDKVIRVVHHSCCRSQIGSWLLADDVTAAV